MKTSRSFLHRVLRIALFGAAAGFLPAGGGSAYATNLAWDSATNEPYATADNWAMGDNGGVGFDGWRQIGDSAPMRSIADGAFVASYDGGAGRSLSTALSSGSFEVSATHGFVSKFSGFALYSASDVELIRFGVTTDEDRETARENVVGFWYCTTASSGVNRYVLFGESSSSAICDNPIDYTISWNFLNSDMSFSISAVGEGISASIENLVLPSITEPVGAVGVLIAANSTADSLKFNNLSVTGAVPEPATISLLSLGALFLWARRRP